MKLPWVPILAILALTAGCRSRPPPAETPTVVAAPAAKPSGFLGDYSQLQPAPDRSGVLIFVDRTADYRPYTKVMFFPVQLYVTPNPEVAEIPRDELKRVTDSLIGSFTKALEPGYQVVTQPGPDVLRVRTGITGIQSVLLPAGAVDHVPIKPLANAGAAPDATRPPVADMAAEMEVLDPSGKRVAAAVATRKSEPTLPQGSLITWNEMQAINDYWAKRLRQRLDELKTSPQGSP